jgi:hypothetical protein
MTLAEYLTSEQAREDVRALLTLTAKTTDRLQKRIGPAMWLEREQIQTWTEVTAVYHDEQKISAYYRPDGDRFVVTDLGEGVRALRLRTGSVSYTYEMRCIPLGLQGARIKDGCVMADHGDPYRADDCIAAADLPDALCRVMLASLKVASTPTEG